MGTVILTAALVAEVTAGRLVSGAPQTAFEGVSIDSRTIPEGALFVALRGDRFDGHRFAESALRLGAAGVLVSDLTDVPADALAILVPDTLAALQAIAHAVRQASKAKVVAVTGSVGKTTTKEVIADLLATRFRVLRNRGNLNNHVGLPASLIELRHGQEVAVVELGMNHAGEIRRLVEIAAPDVRVWTNVGDAHLGHFADREALGRAKAEILEGASASTLVIANADDPLVMAHVDAFVGRRVTFGEGPAADVRATNVIDRGFDGTVAEVMTADGRVALNVPLPGRAQLSNVLAAVAVALELRVPLAAIEETVRVLAPVPRRGASVTVSNGARLVDDSYNSSPTAVQAMLAAMAATAVAGRRIAVLGEMLELGEASRHLHDMCGRAAARLGVDELVAIGGRAADGLVDGALAEGMPAGHVHRFATSAEAAPAVAALVEPGDLILVKGSRGIRTDIVVDWLVEAA
jgi:UDP-N-acetylmuramoyl-tripeptide--D-alanyl-D-alanine ligase